LEPRKQETRNGVETSWFPMKAEVQRCPLSGKKMPTFWDIKKPILEHNQEEGQTVNSTTHSAVL